MVDISGFRAWTLAQPSGWGYDFIDNQNCALAQYLRSLHPEADIWVSPHVYVVDGVMHDLDERLNDAVNGGGSVENKFGALAKRLAKLELA